MDRRITTLTVKPQSHLKLEAVNKIYHRGAEEVHALRDVCLEVEQGEFIAIVGPSGSGKTTLMNMIGCLDAPDSGKVMIDEKTVDYHDEHALVALRRSKIGFIFQQFYLQSSLTVVENVMVPVVFSRRYITTDQAITILERVGLQERIKHYPSQLSGGEMQRTAIARAIIGHPSILLADEPTGNLDSDNAKKIMKIFEELNKTGLTIIFVTHNQELAKRAHRILYLKDGALTP